MEGGGGCQKMSGMRAGNKHGDGERATKRRDKESKEKAKIGEGRRWGGLERLGRVEGHRNELIYFLT